jgi:acetyl esterase
MDELELVNPNNIDLATFDRDAISGENLAEVLHLFETQQGGFPEGQDTEVGNIVDVVVEETGYNTPCKIYYPKGDGPFPFVFQIHGGGFFSGWHFLDEPYVRQLCRDAGCAVVCPSYVMVPQFPFPASLYEMYKTLRHFARQGAAYNLDPGRIAISGGSAGGNIAMAVCGLAADRQELEIGYGVFFYPVLSIETPVACRYDEHTNTGLMPGGYLNYALDTYSTGWADKRDPLLSPLYMDLEKLPDFCLISGRADGLSHENRDFVKRAIDAGKQDCLLLFYGNTPHGFLEGDVDVEAARDAKNIVCTKLKHFFQET